MKHIKRVSSTSAEGDNGGGAKALVVAKDIEEISS